MAYVCVKPLAEKADYLPNDTIDFLVDVGAGNELVGNSFRLEGELEILLQDGPLFNNNVFFDSNAGAHAFIQQAVTMFSDRAVENLNYYGRMASMKSQSLEVPINKMAVSSNASELKCLDDNQTAIIAMLDEDTYERGFTRSFSIKPYICLNNVSGNLAFAKTGQVKVSLTLSSARQALFGADIDNTATFKLHKLQMCCRSVPQSPASSKIVMGVTSCVRQNITSNNTSLSVIVPIPTTSFSATFRNQVSEVDPIANYIQLDTLTGCSRVELTFSDSLSNLIEFPMDTTPEIVLNYLNSMGYTGTHAILQREEVTGIGFNYSQLLQNTKLGINIISDVSNVAPFAMYIYFKGVMGM